MAFFHTFYIQNYGECNTKLSTPPLPSPKQDMWRKKYPYDCFVVSNIQQSWLTFPSTSCTTAYYFHYLFFYFLKVLLVSIYF